MEPGTNHRAEPRPGDPVGPEVGNGFEAADWIDYRDMRAELSSRARELQRLNEELRLAHARGQWASCAAR
ncbi:hypothetical protein [Streptomyces sp. NBC_00237]|uniref:hypothetical protein n=1 Tax=Streptomyces sp. NBC_00237 TaxID=2975687 RepID=UPI002B1E0249|nr:hypothetical protein [Streptomyces sp. NBC_00237]